MDTLGSCNSLELILFCRAFWQATDCVRAWNERAGSVAGSALGVTKLASASDCQECGGAHAVAALMAVEGCPKTPAVDFVECLLRWWKSSTMFPQNISHSSFILLGIPGLEATHHWLSIPLFSMYLVTLLGNSIILLVIEVEASLHKPMYIFLSMLAAIDLVISSATLPKMLCSFLFLDREISFAGCLAQMFFIHSVSVMETTVLVAMAFDRYVAICFPLRYNSFFTGSLAAKIGVAGVVRGTLLMSPCPFLMKRLSFCRTNIIQHTYCEHMAVVKLACGDTSINRAYGLSVALIVIGGDLLCIGLSYFFIVRAVLRLSSIEARFKAFGTCASHLCVIFISYTPALFSFFTHRFGHNVAPHIHILLANLYLLFPPMLNPIVYGVRTKEIREQIIRVFLPSRNMVKSRSV
ncbi:olfactory receptor 52P1-like [Liasis olivaceus]